MVKIIYKNSPEIIHSDDVYEKPEFRLVRACYADDTNEVRYLLNKYPDVDVNAIVLSAPKRGNGSALIPLKLKAGIGYGIIKSVDDSGWGVQYEVGGEYLLYKSLGIGVKYKYAEADLLGTTFKNDSTVFMMIFGY